MLGWIAAVAFLGVLFWIMFRPLSIEETESRPEPIRPFEEAVLRVRAMQEEDNKDFARDVCISKLFDHGEQTEHVIVLLHGFTNCPEQFYQLGMQYFEAGYNVLIPRMPYHGRSDRLTDALIDLTVEDLTAFGDRVVDIAHGLGKKVTILGISGSGTLVCWLAQNRADLDYVISIAPLFGLAFIPPAFTRPFERLALLLPNFFLWWDPRTKAENPYSIFYAYPRYPTKALVEILRLGMITRAQAEKSAPKASRIVMVLNDAEPAVSNGEILRLIRLWKRNQNVNLNEYHFEKEMKLPHDIITPGTPGVPVSEIQPRLIGVVQDLHANH
jgi:alpha-beta hydrolase superfamily lysophospholipase